MGIYVVASCPFSVEKQAWAAIAACPRKELVWYAVVSDVPNVVSFALENPVWDELEAHGPCLQAVQLHG